jgi:hypothetical protein
LDWDDAAAAAAARARAAAAATTAELFVDDDEELPPFDDADEPPPGLRRLIFDCAFVASATISSSTDFYSHMIHIICQFLLLWWSHDRWTK